MPQAVTHVLIPIILLSIFRHIYQKKTGKKFHLQYVLIGGLAGVIPDIDIPIFWVLFRTNTSNLLAYNIYSDNFYNFSFCGKSYNKKENWKK